MLVDNVIDPRFARFADDRPVQPLLTFCGARRSRGRRSLPRHNDFAGLLFVGRTTTLRQDLVRVRVLVQLLRIFTAVMARRTRIVQRLVLSRRHRGQRVLSQQARRCATKQRRRGHNRSKLPLISDALPGQSRSRSPSSPTRPRQWPRIQHPTRPAFATTRNSRRGNALRPLTPRRNPTSQVFRPDALFRRTHGLRSRAMHGGSPARANACSLTAQRGHRYRQVSTSRAAYDELTQARHHAWP